MHSFGMLPHLLIALSPIYDDGIVDARLADTLSGRGGCTLSTVGAVLAGGRC